MAGPEAPTVGVDENTPAVVTIEKAPGKFRVRSYNAKGNILGERWENTDYQAGQAASIERGKSAAAIVRTGWNNSIEAAFGVIQKLTKQS